MAGQDEDERIIERGGDEGTLRLQWIEVPPVVEIEIFSERALETVTRERSLEIDISQERPLEISLHALPRPLPRRGCPGLQRRQ